MNLKTTEAIRAAAEAVGEYLQAPPSMWNTIERLIAQQTTATLSSHNTQIREVLEGLSSLLHIPNGEP